MVYLQCVRMQNKKNELRSATDLCGPEPEGGAGPAYAVIVVAPSKLTWLSGGKVLLGVLSDGRRKTAYQQW
jgi:hypothetical protein